MLRWANLFRFPLVMPYSSSNKIHDKARGRTSNPLVEAAARASMSAAGPGSAGDGSISTTLSPSTDPFKASRFKEDAGEDAGSGSETSGPETNS